MHYYLKLPRDCWLDIQNTKIDPIPILHPYPCFLTFLSNGHPYIFFFSFHGNVFSLIELMPIIILFWWNWSVESLAHYKTDL